MDQLAFKLLLISLMFVLSVICGLLPLKFLQFLRKRAASPVDLRADRKWPSMLLCLVTCFSGGVFLATCFLHLLPEVTEQMKEIVEEHGWPSSYPLAELISCGGFFLVFLIEEFVILCLRGGGHSHNHHRHHHGNGVVHVHLVPAGRASGSSSSSSSSSATIRIKEHHHPVVRDHQSSPRATRPLVTDDQLDFDKAALTPAPTTTDSPVVPGGNGISAAGGAGEVIRTTAFPLLSPCGDTISGHRLVENTMPMRTLSAPVSSTYPSPVLRDGSGVFTYCHDTDVPAVLSLKRRPIVSSKGPGADNTVQDSSGNCPGIELPLNAEPECCEGPCEGRKEDPPIMMAYRPHAHSHGVRSVTLVVALSFHSLIEGLALGIQDTKSATTALFLGILIHKCIILFSTGVQLARTHAHQLCLVVATIVLVSLMSPVGAGVGVAVEQSWRHSLTRDVTVVFFSGLSVGTFLYVTFFEVLIHERDNEHNNLLKLVAILAGFLLMAALRVIHDHSHGGHGGAGASQGQGGLAGNTTTTANATTTTIGP